METATVRIPAEKRDILKIIAGIEKTEIKEILTELIDEYIERIRRYCKLEIKEVREESRDSAAGPRERTEREGKKILKALRPGEFWIALDERGDQMTSEEFATVLGRVLEEKPAGVKIIIGGPFGLSQEVLEKAHWRLALSRFARP